MKRWLSILLALVLAVSAIVYLRHSGNHIPEESSQNELVLIPGTGDTEPASDTGEAAAPEAHAPPAETVQPVETVPSESPSLDGQTDPAAEFNGDPENSDNSDSGQNTPDEQEPSVPEEPSEPAIESPAEETLAEDGSYTSKEDVALFIHLYGRLPDNFITKREARALGWSSGSLERYAPGKSIGGDRFGNYEGNLPEAEGRVYTECDIDTQGASKRGAKRIVFSNDGLVFYTEDHYETFELLYGEE